MDEPPPTLHSGIISISVLPMLKPETTGGKIKVQQKREDVQVKTTLYNKAF